MRLDRSLIAGLPFFAGMEGEDLDLILSLAQSARYPKETEVFAQGAEANRFFFLLAGHIRAVRTTPEGEQVIARYINQGEMFGIAVALGRPTYPASAVANINQGEMFGIAVALGRPTYPASAVAAVDCVVLSWPNSAWPELQSRIPAFSANTYRTVGVRLQETQTRVVEMSTQAVEQRIAGALLKLANQAGRKTEDGIEIGFPLTRQNIAEMTGTTLYTVSRLLSAWEQEGIVRSARQRVVVTDAHTLFLIAENRRPK